jgi:hypothetical protein
MPRSARPSRSIQDGANVSHLLAEAFRSAGWKVQIGRLAGDRRADLVVSKGRHRYVVEFAVASEGRRDRLIGLLSQAILQARSLASEAQGAGPLAVVAAPMVSHAVQRALLEFHQRHVPQSAIGIVDRRGLRAFAGPGLESLNSIPQPAQRSTVPAPGPAVNLFSDLNQWMLKVLLASHVQRQDLMSGAMPRGEYRNASALAKAAGVSVMSAFRLVSQLENEAFLNSAGPHLRLVRIERLLQRWQASCARTPREWPTRWLLRSQERDQVVKTLGRLGPRACLGLFAAARALGLRHVEGVPVHVYVEEVEPGLIRAAGLTDVPPGQQPDVVLRAPRETESVFRGAVSSDGVRVSDALQVWLDVSSHPARGREQADLIFRQVIKPMIRSVHDQH